MASLPGSVDRQAPSAPSRLLDLPLELRTIIYEQLFLPGNPPVPCDLFRADRTYRTLILEGSSPFREPAEVKSRPRSRLYIWTLMEVCQQLCAEIKAFLEVIEPSLIYEFRHFTESDMDDWIVSAGRTRVTGMTRWVINGVADCQQRVRREAATQAEYRREGIRKSANGERARKRGAMMWCRCHNEAFHSYVLAVDLDGIGDSQVDERITAPAGTLPGAQVWNRGVFWDLTENDEHWEAGCETCLAEVREAMLDTMTSVYKDADTCRDGQAPETKRRTYDRLPYMLETVTMGIDYGDAEKHWEWQFWTERADGRWPDQWL